MLFMFCAICALSYVLSTIGMKYWDTYPKGVIATFIAVTIALAVWSEIQALRHADMALTLIVIIGLEAAIALSAGYFILGESLTISKLSGACLVLAGVVLIQFSQQSG